MESRARLLGHPIHPMLIVLPLGLFVSAFLFDIGHIWTGRDTFTIVSFWNIVGGILSGLFAAIFGLIDWLAIPDHTRAKRIGLLHGVGNVAVVVLFAASAWLRFEPQAHVPSALAIVLSTCGVGLGAVTGWLGGELVDRLGVGVSDGAHLDAPSSLDTRRAPMGTRRPA
jgi:uncharacterized membrane protein